MSGAGIVNNTRLASGQGAKIPASVAFAWRTANNIGNQS